VQLTIHILRFNKQPEKHSTSVVL